MCTAPTTRWPIITASPSSCCSSSATAACTAPSRSSVRQAAKDFATPASSSIAISSDDAAGLKQSIENYKDGTDSVPARRRHHARHLQGLPLLRRLRAAAAARHVLHRRRRPRPLAGHQLRAVQGHQVPAGRSQAAAGPIRRGQKVPAAAAGEQYLFSPSVFLAF